VYYRGGRFSRAGSLLPLLLVALLVCDFLGVCGFLGGRQLALLLQSQHGNTSDLGNAASQYGST
jgi:hypothetical protein